jgi:hypothetical protein
MCPDEGSNLNVNPFSRNKADLTHLSSYVIERLEVHLRGFTAAEIGAMAESWSIYGYMNLFSALFERNARVELQTGRTLPLFAVIPDGGKSQAVESLEVPPATKILLFCSMTMTAVQLLWPCQRITSSVY